MNWSVLVFDGTTGLYNSYDIFAKSMKIALALAYGYDRARYASTGDATAYRSRVFTVKSDHGKAKQFTSAEVADEIIGIAISVRK